MRLKVTCPAQKFSHFGDFLNGFWWKVKFCRFCGKKKYLNDVKKNTENIIDKRFTKNTLETPENNFF